VGHAVRSQKAVEDVSQIVLDLFAEDASSMLTLNSVSYADDGTSGGLTSTSYNRALREKPTSTTGEAGDDADDEPGTFKMKQESCGRVSRERGQTQPPGAGHDD
jgi:hypothetical protein